MFLFSDQVSLVELLYKHFEKYNDLLSSSETEELSKNLINSVLLTSNNEALNFAEQICINHSNAIFFLLLFLYIFTNLLIFTRISI